MEAAESTQPNRIVQPTVAPSPFLKWAGGKTRLLTELEARLPGSFEQYHEPFVGGGALFFRLLPGDATLSDLNTRLIGCYEAIRDNVDELIERLRVHRRRHTKAYYYTARTRFNAIGSGSPIDRAALMIYLNKTCFNGLYRENSRGEFNVPMGRYKNPSVFDPSHLRAVSHALQDVELRVGSFEDVLDRAEPGDLVYFDPPYVPVTETANFTSYTKDGFDMSLQHRLAKVFAELARRGCMVMLSNSDTRAVRELYRGWRVDTVQAPRAISAKGRGRGSVSEVIVRSW